MLPQVLFEEIFTGLSSRRACFIHFNILSGIFRRPQAVTHTPQVPPKPILISPFSTITGTLRFPPVSLSILSIAAWSFFYIIVIIGNLPAVKVFPGPLPYMDSLPFQIPVPFQTFPQYILLSSYLLFLFFITEKFKSPEIFYLSKINLPNVCLHPGHFFHFVSLVAGHQLVDCGCRLQALKQNLVNLLSNGHLHSKTS